METPSPAALIISGAFPLCPIDYQLGVMEDAAGVGPGTRSNLPWTFSSQVHRGVPRVFTGSWCALGEDPRLTRKRVGSEVSKPSRDGVLRLAAVQADGFVPANHQPSGRSPTRAKFRYSGSTPPPKGVLPGVAIVLNS